MTTYRGTIEKGRLVLESGEQLRDGQEVTVMLRHARAAAPGARGKKPSRRAGVKDSLLSLITELGEIAGDDGMPSDLSLEHDHYIYGSPKKYNRDGTLKKRTSAKPNVRRARSSGPKRRRTR
jgi:hypothetical protein